MRTGCSSGRHAASAMRRAGFLRQTGTGATRHADRNVRRRLAWEPQDRCPKTQRAVCRHVLIDGERHYSATEVAGVRPLITAPLAAAPCRPTKQVMTRFQHLPCHPICHSIAGLCPGEPIRSMPDTPWTSSSAGATTWGAPSERSACRLRDVRVTAIGIAPTALAS